MIREKVKNLWKLCFNDSEEFTELYFRNGIPRIDAA